jgi:two-component system phosphate regulon response regulator OmpR
MKVLVIDDDEKLQDLLSQYLTEYGYELFRHTEGTGAFEAINEIKPDMVLLDVMLPGINGIDLLRKIREEKTLPVIMLTAKGDEADRIVGLELGADDYIAKPFNPRELLARMKAVMRRSAAGERPSVREKMTAIRLGDLCLNPATMTLDCGEKKSELSKTEYRIMEALMSNPDTVLSRDAIMNIAKGREFIAFERSIDVHISKLRLKVEEVSGSKNRIKTIWGTGYMFIS